MSTTSIQCSNPRTGEALIDGKQCDDLLYKREVLYEVLQDRVSFPSGDNNAVSRDRAGPPDRLKWTGGTRRARSHMSAVTVISMVSGGRLYTIEDLETVEYHRLPGK